MAGPQGNGALLASIKESQEQASAGELNRTSQSRNSDRSSFQSHTSEAIFNEKHEDEGRTWNVGGGGNGTSLLP